MIKTKYLNTLSDELKFHLVILKSILAIINVDQHADRVNGTF